HGFAVKTRLKEKEAKEQLEKPAEKPKRRYQVILESIKAFINRAGKAEKKSRKEKRAKVKAHESKKEPHKEEPELPKESIPKRRYQLLTESLNEMVNRFRRIEEENVEDGYKQPVPAACAAAAPQFAEEPAHSDNAKIIEQLKEAYKIE
ncbi:hypothetical protein KY361_07830, partial [Candidatus Woesearchaeota archaeon]|nr:hypothetical protein [Candidatus Woesearchaeota archaeon]